MSPAQPSTKKTVTSFQLPTFWSCYTANFGVWWCVCGRGGGGLQHTSWSFPTPTPFWCHHMVSVCCSAMVCVPCAFVKTVWRVSDSDRTARWEPTRYDLLMPQRVSAIGFACGIGAQSLMVHTTIHFCHAVQNGNKSCHNLSTNLRHTPHHHRCSCFCQACCAFHEQVALHFHLEDWTQPPVQ
jgi:hypothetical protein